MECPACNSKRTKIRPGTMLFDCTKCQAVFGKAYLGESYDYVLPQFDPNPNPPEQRYFDFMCLSSKGVVRRHGWFNPATKLLTQVG